MLFRDHGCNPVLIREFLKITLLMGEKRGLLLLFSFMR
jgi:hypothetical protein